MRPDKDHKPSAAASVDAREPDATRLAVAHPLSTKVAHPSPPCIAGDNLAKALFLPPIMR
ncbi:MAG: hypothetical protein DPW22_05205 [Alphaproteobacteria bacterium]|nr:hypothetical protein [Alphaproteobacteria bacterium]